MTKYNCESWNEFLHLSATKPMIFRGHRDINWPLVPELFRDTYTGLNSENKLHEQIIIQESYFREYLEVYTAKCFVQLLMETPCNFSQLPFTLDATDVNNRIKIFTVGRHYGLHVPFLDWTTNPCVAAVFALNNYSSGRICIWGLENDPISTNLKQLVPHGDLLREKKQSAIQVELVNPFLDVKTALDEAGDSNNLNCYIFEQSAIEDIKNMLISKSINNDALFPDNSLDLGSYLESAAQKTNNAREKVKSEIYRRLSHKMEHLQEAGNFLIKN